MNIPWFLFHTSLSTKKAASVTRRFGRSSCRDPPRAEDPGVPADGGAAKKWGILSILILPIYSWFTHSKWWFSIVLVVYQRLVVAPETGTGSTSNLLNQTWRLEFAWIEGFREQNRNGNWVLQFGILGSEQFLRKWGIRKTMFRKAIWVSNETIQDQTI